MISVGTAEELGALEELFAQRTLATSHILK